MGHCGYTEPPDTEWRHSAVGGARKPVQGLPVLSVAFHRSSSVGRPSSNWSSSETITASTKLSCWFHCTPHPSQYWVHWQHILGSRTKTHWARDWKPTLKGLLPSRRAALRVAISQLIQSQVLHYIYSGKFYTWQYHKLWLSVPVLLPFRKLVLSFWSCTSNRGSLDSTSEPSSTSHFLLLLACCFADMAWGCSITWIWGWSTQEREHRRTTMKCHTVKTIPCDPNNHCMWP